MSIVFRIGQILGLVQNCVPVSTPINQHFGPPANHTNALPYPEKLESKRRRNARNQQWWEAFRLWQVRVLEELLQNKGSRAKIRERQSVGILSWFICFLQDNQFAYSLMSWCRLFLVWMWIIGRHVASAATLEFYRRISRFLQHKPGHLHHLTSREQWVLF